MSTLANVRLSDVRVSIWDDSRWSFSLRHNQTENRENLTQSRDKFQIIQGLNNHLLRIGNNNQEATEFILFELLLLLNINFIT